MNKVHKPKPFSGKRIPAPIFPPDNRFIFNHPVFCLRYLHKDYNVASCSNDDRASLITKMANFCQLTWDEIKLAPRHGMGSEKISRSSIKPSIPSEITEDVDSFLALRYQGKKVFVGFRNQFIFHIVYIDRDFTVYNH
jgi:hypothetical protein